MDETCVVVHPLVTVCITAYRRPTLLIQAILSCTNQDYRPLAIDISDDSPTLDVQETFEALVLPQDVSVRFRRNTVSLGEPDNVNSLFREARGAYVLLLHDDDVLLPGAITRLTQSLLSHPTAAVAFGMQEIITNNGERDESATEDLNVMYRREPRHAGILSDSLLSALCRQVPNNGYLICAEIAKAIRYRTVKEIGRAGDTDYMIRVALAYPARAFIFIPYYTTRYRLTQGSSRTQPGVCWKLYEELRSLEELSPEQSRARDLLVTSYAPRALIDNLTHGERLKAALIFITRSYRKNVSLDRKTYHFILLCIPTLYRFRKLFTTKSHS